MAAASAVAGVWRGVCRASYYISLLGLKIPLGLLAKASHARLVLGFVLLAWLPFLGCCHCLVLPKVQGQAAWQGLTLLWVTLPLLTVGAVILSVARTPRLFLTFFAALLAMAAFHLLAIPAFVGTAFSRILLHLSFAFFEDMPMIVWIWCLVHVVRLQDHVAGRQAGRASPFAAAEGRGGAAPLIVGNAPTVTDGEPLGALIDKFADVVRFNSYKVDRPEFTGSRVGFHFCNGRNFPQSKAVQAVCPLFSASLTHAVYLFMPHAEEAPEIYASLTSSKVDAWFIPEEEIMELRRKIGCRFWQIPTSGAVAINAFLSARDKVTLHGFNFFQGKKIHYFEESATQLITSWLERFVTHDPLREKRWVESLAASGRASFLAAQAPNSPTADKAAEPGQASEELAGEKASKAKKEGEQPRRRPGLVQTLLKDGLPSQFSL